MREKTFALVVTAAGSSTRFNKHNVKKEFLRLENGHTVLYSASFPFYSVPGLKAVIVTAKEGTVEETKIALEDLCSSNIPTIITSGGETRSQSVANALLYLKNNNIDVDYVAIHDGARPYITTDLILNILNTAYLNTAAVPGIAITDSIRKVDSNNNIVEIVSREGLYSVQTPQIFNYKLLLEAIEKNTNINATDEAEVFINSGHPVTICPGAKENRKITFENDIVNVDEQIKEYRGKK